MKIFSGGLVKKELRTDFSAIAVWEEFWGGGSPRETCRQEWFITFAPGGHFSNEKTSWKAENEGFPTPFFVWKTTSWNKTYEPFLSTGFVGWLPPSEFFPKCNCTKVRPLKSVRNYFFLPVPLKISSFSFYTFVFTRTPKSLLHVVLFVKTKNNFTVIEIGPISKTWGVIMLRRQYYCDNQLPQFFGRGVTLYCFNPRKHR